jgi:hypothetical protein
LKREIMSLPQEFITLAVQGLEAPTRAEWQMMYRSGFLYLEHLS